MRQLRVTHLASIVTGLVVLSASAQTNITGDPDVRVAPSNGSTAAVFHVFNYNGAEIFRVQSDGNVGIGTASAGYPLDLKSNGTTPFRIDGTNNPGFVIANNGTTMLAMGVVTGSNNFILNSVTNDVAVRATGGGKLLFSTSPSGTTNDLTLKGGKVGIGTANPNAILTVQSGVAESYADIAVGRTGPEVRLGIAASAGQFATDALAGDSVLRVESSSQKLHLLAGAGRAVMTIASDSVGIGATAPTSLLQIGSSYPAHFVDMSTVGVPAGVRLDMAGNGEIDVAGITIGKTALPVIQSADGFSLYLNRTSNNDVEIGGNGTTGGLKVKGTGPSSFAGNVTVTGAVTATTVYANYQDVAEWVPATESMAAGTVVVISDETNNTVRASTRAYDTGVAGVISQGPGILLGVESASKAKVATTGRVKVRVVAAPHPVRIGDLLVTSGVPGFAMKSEPIDVGGAQIHRPGTLIGKALEPLESGKGEILVLLSLQ